MPSKNNESKLKYVDVKDFSDGLNTLDDPAVLANGETPYCINMDVTSMGTVVTRFGYDLVATIPAVTGALRGLHAYYRTYDDNTTIDQAVDNGGAAAQTYTPLTSISETGVNKCTFTPTQTKIVKIAIWPTIKGTGDWTLTLHNAANTRLASYTIANAQITIGSMQYFIVPYTWTSGALHFHITSTVADGACKVGTVNDFSTASFIETYSTIGDYFIFHHSNGTSYYVTNSNWSPASIGSFGTDNGNVHSVTFNNYAIYANGGASNGVQKWNSVTLAQVLSTQLPVKRFEVFENRLMATENAWGPSTIYYSNPGDETSLLSNFVTVNVGDGTNVTGMIPLNDTLQIYKENSIHAMSYSFDSNYNLTVPQVQPIVNANGGAVSGNTIQGVYGYSYFLSRKNIESYGPTPFRYLANQPIPLSLKITPLVRSINYGATNAMSSAFFQDKYYLSVPTNGDSLSDTTIVYNESVRRRFNKDAFMIYQGWPVQQFQIFRDTNHLDQLYFSSNAEPKVYKLNMAFSDQGYGYSRIWRSKTFREGERTSWKYLDLEGAKVQDAIIYIDLYCDGSLVTTIPITDSNFLTSSAGGSNIGYSYLGSDYVGGGAYANAPAMYAWKKRIAIPQSVNYGYEFYFQLRNQELGHGWALSRYVLAYTQDPEAPSYSRTD